MTSAQQEQGSRQHRTLVCSGQVEQVMLTNSKIPQQWQRHFEGISALQLDRPAVHVGPAAHGGVVYYMQRGDHCSQDEKR